MMRKVAGDKAMDNLVRFAALLTLGAVLLLANIWYLRTLISFFYPNEYVIMPIRLVGKEDKDGAFGIGYAQMLQAQLKHVEQDLADSQRQLSTPVSEKSVASRPIPAGAPSILPLIPAQALDMPTSLLEPANINVSVGGVSVGGAVAWLQNLLVGQRILNFTIEFCGENRIIIAGDIRPPLSSTDNGSILLESCEPEDKVISRLVYVLLLKHLTSVGGRGIGGLINVDDFQALADGLHQTASLNQRIAQGGQQRSEEFRSIFHEISPIAFRVLGWPELKYFAANLAELGNENLKAIQLYKQFKETRLSPGTSAEALKLIDSGDIDKKVAILSSTLAEGAGKFDFPVTIQDSTEHAVVYYETDLGEIGSMVAQAVSSKFENDFAKLTSFFGGVKPPKRFNIIVAAVFGVRDGSGGAYHSACDAEDIYADVMNEPNLNTDRTNFLVLSQAVDVFAAARDKRWDCGNSYGSALKRALAAELYPKEIEVFATGPAWLGAGAPDYVTINEPTDQNPVSTGCAVLFLNYMHTQLKKPWETIIQAGGTTPGQTYTNLGLGKNDKDGYSKLVNLINTRLPKGGLKTDNPFPLPD